MLNVTFWKLLKFPIPLGFCRSLFFRTFLKFLPNISPQLFKKYLFCFLVFSLWAISWPLWYFFAFCSFQLKCINKDVSLIELRHTLRQKVLLFFFHLKFSIYFIFSFLSWKHNTLFLNFAKDKLTFYIWRKMMSF